MNLSVKLSSAALRLKKAPRKIVVIAASIALLVLLMIGAAASALWQASSAFAGGRTQTGDLQVLRGEGQWQQVTPGVSDPASGPLNAETQPFVSMPGDVIELTIPVTTKLQGENLNARMLVEAGSAVSEVIDSGEISASYRVLTADGTQAGPASGEAELGAPVSVQGLASSNEGITADWKIVVTVNVLGDYRWTAQQPLLDLSSWSVDGVSVSLQQTRSGEGFAAGSGDEHAEGKAAL